MEEKNKHLRSFEIAGQELFLQQSDFAVIVFNYTKYTVIFRFF